MAAAPRIVERPHVHEAHRGDLRVRGARGAASAPGPCRAISARSSTVTSQVSGEMGAQMRLVGGLVGGVDHEDEAVAASARP